MAEEYIVLNIRRTGWQIYKRGEQVNEDTWMYYRYDDEGVKFYKTEEAAERKARELNTQVLCPCGIVKRCAYPSCQEGEFIRSLE